MDKAREYRLVNLFRLADQSFKRAIDKKVADTVVYRSQHRILMILGEHPDCSQTELAEKLDISPAAVAVTLKKLEKAGYISRQCSAEDNRMNHVVMTDKGLRTIDISLSYFQEIEDALFRGFSGEETALLEEFFLRIIKNGEDYYQNMR